MGDLNMDSILTGDEAANLFLDEIEEKQEDSTSDKNEEKDDDATEVNPENLFADEPESVGSEDSRGKEDTNSELGGTSPNNFYYSIASALKEEGIFPDLDDEELNSVNEAEDFKQLVEKQIQAGLNEAQRRVYNALNSGVRPDAIREYESTLSNLASITEEAIEDESEQGEILRRKLIQLDFMNRGYKPERAAAMTEKLFNSNEDIEEAKQALIANKEHFTARYNALLNEAKRLDDQDKNALKHQVDTLRKNILEGDKIFGDVPIDKNTRKKVFDNIMKPVYRNKETGEYYTAIQKYKMENENEYLKNVGILFTLTDGFKNIERLVKPSAKKEVKKKLKELEYTLNNTSTSNGNLHYVSSAKNNGSIFDNDFTIDLSLY